MGVVDVFPGVCRYTYRRKGIRWQLPLLAKRRISTKLDTSRCGRHCPGDGANETTVRAWLREERSPSGIYAERLAELSSGVDRLVAVMPSTYVPVWMRKPVPLLDDDKPLDVIATGDYRRVSRVVAGLEVSGAI